MKRALLNDFRVDGEKLLDPDVGVTVSYSDIEADSARDESGFLHRTVARYDVRTWEFSYSVLTVEEHNYLLGLFRGKAVFQFGVTNADGTEEIVTCYCTKKSTSYYSKRLGLYKNLKFTIVEC